MLRFFYAELAQTQAGKRSIFEPAGGGLFTLRSDVYLHLYISVLPCGDAKMFSVNDNAHFLRPLQGIHSHNGCGHPLPTYQDINGHWPSMGRKCEGLLRARLDTGESYSPLPPSFDEEGVDATNPRIRKVRITNERARPEIETHKSAEAWP